MPLIEANLVSDWRRALMSELQTAHPDADVTAGRRTGVSRDQERIAVFFDGYSEQAARVVVANPVMVVRFWPDRSKLPADTPEDPTQLEQAAVDLMRLLQARQAQIENSVDDLWYFRVQSVVIDEDPEEWGVEARLLGFAKNVAAVA
jgi:hypothetical protein